MPIHLNTAPRRFPYHGTLSSQELTELTEALYHDLKQLSDTYNKLVEPLLTSLPGGSRIVLPEERSGTVDPLTNGLDGSQIYVDATAADPSHPLLYNRLAGRPNTILEALEYLLNRIEQLRREITRE